MRKPSLLLYICTMSSANKYNTPKKNLSQYLDPFKDK